MPLIASEFGGRYGLPLGCALLVLLPLFGIIWILLQLKSFLKSERLSWLSLVLIVLFTFVPGFVVVTSLPGLRTSDALGKFLFYGSAFGIALVPLTLGWEFLKFRRDRDSAARGRRRPPAEPEADRLD
jgi:hypothetical protein